ncbi:hypothetical protein C8R43DRAFT_954630 [Mycena crocata]|nr:hypothetical protein C8R43DRAFT_954630 [Mycena crocata]
MSSTSPTPWPPNYTIQELCDILVQETGLTFSPFSLQPGAMARHPTENPSRHIIFHPSLGKWSARHFTYLSSEGNPFPDHFPQALLVFKAGKASPIAAAYWTASFHISCPVTRSGPLYNPGEVVYQSDIITYDIPIHALRPEDGHFIFSVKATQARVYFTQGEIFNPHVALGAAAALIGQTSECGRYFDFCEKKKFRHDIKDLKSLQSFLKSKSLKAGTLYDWLVESTISLLLGARLTHPHLLDTLRELSVTKTLGPTRFPRSEDVLADFNDEVTSAGSTSFHHAPQAIESNESHLLIDGDIQMNSDIIEELSVSEQSEAMTEDMVHFSGPTPTKYPSQMDEYFFRIYGTLQPRPMEVRRYVSGHSDGPISDFETMKANLWDPMKEEEEDTLPSGSLPGARKL